MMVNIDYAKEYRTHILIGSFLLGNFISRSTVINTTAHHTVHHLYFNYNYGQYFTFWDRLGGSHREPTDEQYNAELRSDKKVWAQQAKEAESIEAEVLRKRNKQKSN